MIDANELKERDPLGTELVQLCLALRPHLPNLVSDYLGPAEWLTAARLEPSTPRELLSRSRRLLESADRSSDAYVAAQARAVVTQIELALEPGRYPYVELVERLLACRFTPPDEAEIEALEDEVIALARQLGGSGADPLGSLESARMIDGEAKWDVALDAYRAGRAYAFERFPIPFEERLDIGRTSDPITSLHLTWREPDRMVFEVNVGVPRAPSTVRYEVFHNIYPGDYLHMAVLTQRTFALEGRVAACIKLKNAPENVIAEGIEETAPFRIDPAPPAADMLAWKLEWLRRGATLGAAVGRRQHQRSRDEVLARLRRTGHMDAGRAEQELARIEHPLWGTYQYTYWLGRHLVQEADRRAGPHVEGAVHLGRLYGGLHVPETFLAGMDPVPLKTVAP